MQITPILKRVEPQLLKFGKEYKILIEGVSVEGSFTAVFTDLVLVTLTETEYKFKINESIITIIGTGWSAWEALCKG